MIPLSRLLSLPICIHVLTEVGMQERGQTAMTPSYAPTAVHEGKIQTKGQFMLGGNLSVDLCQLFETLGIVLVNL